MSTSIAVTPNTVSNSFQGRKGDAMPNRQIERHRTNRVGWLRAAVLGANDGLLSTSSLVLGVAAAHGTHSSVLVAGLSGMVAGAMSMAAGEYVSVHSQADTVDADLQLERKELQVDPSGERDELASIYVGRGLDPDLAGKVAQQLMAHNALDAHARDELGITQELSVLGNLVREFLLRKLTTKVPGFEQGKPLGVC